MPATITHCQPARRRQATLAARMHAAVVALVASALTYTACGGGSDDQQTATPAVAVAAAPQPVEPLAEAERAYFPSQFPAPHGEIEPLPEQF